MDSYSQMDEKCISKVNYKETTSRIIRQLIRAQPRIPRGNFLESNVLLEPQRCRGGSGASINQGKERKKEKGNLGQETFMPLALRRQYFFPP